MGWVEGGCVWEGRINLIIEGGREGGRERGTERGGREGEGWMSISLCTIVEGVCGGKWASCVMVYTVYHR